MNKEPLSTLKENIFSPLGIFGILMFFGFISFGYMFARGLSSMAILTNANGITVSGTSERFVTSDRGSISLLVKTDSQYTSDNDAQERLSRAQKSLVKYLVNSGIEEKDIDVLAYNSSSQCSERQSGNWDNCIGKKYTEYTQTINLASNDVTKIKDLSLTINSKVNSSLPDYFSNVQLTVQNTQYFYTKLPAVKSEMLNESTKNAFERAESIAKSTGNSAGAVITASQGVFQITSKDSTDSSDYGSYDTSTIEKKITAVVRVSFKVK
jgi:uncharacterized protein